MEAQADLSVATVRETKPIRGWLVHPCHALYEKPKQWFATNYNQYDRQALNIGEIFLTQMMRAVDGAGRLNSQIVVLALEN
jgi:hypothetical protein